MTSRPLCVLLFATAVAAAQAPVNDNCTLVFGLQNGVNPQPPSGLSGQTYTNVGATDSVAPAPSGCAPFYKDVWFSYTAPITGPVQFSTCTPPGFAAGTLSDTTLAVYASSACGTTAAPLGCNDDGCSGSLRSTVTVNVSHQYIYLIRVGSFQPAASGTFYVTVTEPAVSPNAACATAPAATVGSWTNGSLAGCFLAPNNIACGLSNTVGYWLRYDSGSFVGTRQLSAEITGAGATYVDIWTGPCASIAPFSCNAVGINQVAINPSTTYWIRISKWATTDIGSIDFQYRVLVDATPPNASCATPYVVTDGVYPKNPGDMPYFTNAGSLTSHTANTFCSGAYGNNDVFFEYVATTSGKTVVSTATPAGKTPGSLADTVLYAYQGCFGALLQCNDDASPSTTLSELEFDAVQGQSYLFRVSTKGPSLSEGTFYLTIRPKFTLAMSSPFGFGSFRLKNEFAAPFHFVFNCLTLQQGSYPYGPFFGIEPTITELALQIDYGQAPFVAAVDGVGSYVFDYAGALPPLTVYGVAIQFDFLGQVAGVSKPTSHQIF